jgi:homoserine O-acetyltransferase
MRFLHVMALVALVLAPLSATAADYPAPMSGDWVAKNFRFHTGAVMDVRLHYVTVGDPKGIPVLVLHGTYGSGGSMVNPA